MTFRDRLENWAEAARSGRIGHSGTCIGSLEGRYRSNPRSEDDDQPKRQIRPEPNFVDAEVINAAWLLLPRDERIFIKFLYVDNKPVPFLCRRFKIKHWPMSVFDIYRAKVEKKIEHGLVNRKFPAHNVATI